MFLLLGREVHAITPYIFLITPPYVWKPIYKYSPPSSSLSLSTSLSYFFWSVVKIDVAQDGAQDPIFDKIEQVHSGGPFKAN